MIQIAAKTSGGNICLVLGRPNSVIAQLEIEPLTFEYKRNISSTLVSLKKSMPINLRVSRTLLKFKITIWLSIVVANFNFHYERQLDLRARMPLFLLGVFISLAWEACEPCVCRGKLLLALSIKTYWKLYQRLYITWQKNFHCFYIFRQTILFL